MKFRSIIRVLSWFAFFIFQSIKIVVRKILKTLYTDRPIDLVVECSPMIRETGVQYQFESYQKLKKRYLITTCLTLGIIRYVSWVNWSNQGKRVAPSPTYQYRINWKRSLRVTLDYGRQLHLIHLSSLLLFCFRCNSWIKLFRTFFFSLPSFFSNFYCTILNSNELNNILTLNICIL